MRQLDLGVALHMHICTCWHKTDAAERRVPRAHRSWQAKQLDAVSSHATGATSAQVGRQSPCQAILLNDLTAQAGVRAAYSLLTYCRQVRHTAWRTCISILACPIL